MNDESTAYGFMLGIFIGFFIGVMAFYLLGPS